jgi:peptide/nickel transport system ATP-binding protein
MAGSGDAHLRDRDDIVLRVEHLVVQFRTGKGTVHAVSDISFDLAAGETLGLVGESGCGKSTAARSIMQVPRPTSGHVWFEGTDLTTLDGKELRRTRPHLQMIFQDPISSLNPRRKVRDVIAEGLSIWGGKEDGDRVVDEVLRNVGLDPATVGDRRPHQFSGGQCQRICIARSLVLDPTVLICDEPVSALDVSVQAQILNLLEETKERYGLTLLFIAHDLAVVKNVSDRVAVMYLGKLCEIGPAEQIYERPAHPYTKALLEAVPEPDPDAVLGENVLAGDLPSPLDPPSGCRFRTRCPLAADVCAEEEPVLREMAPGQFAACHFAEQVIADSEAETTAVAGR